MRPMTDSEMQQSWWDSMTPEQRESYQDHYARERAEREVYGRVLTDAERIIVLREGMPAKRRIIRAEIAAGRLGCPDPATFTQDERAAHARIYAETGSLIAKRLGGIS